MINISNQRRLVQVVKAFFDKAILPQLPSNDNSVDQWKQFMSILAADCININEAELYVDNLPIPNAQSSAQQIISVYNIKKKQQKQALQFKANKTFGGQVSKIAIFASQEREERKERQREYSVKRTSHNNSNSISQGLEKLLKTMKQNQKLIDNTAAVKHEHNRQHNQKNGGGKVTDSYKHMSNPPQYKSYY